MAKITLTMTEEQAKIVSLACEFYARVKMGQFQEISFRCLDLSIPEKEYCKRRDKAERFLLEARDWIYPDIYGFGNSYGYGKFVDADIAFDIHQVIRKQFLGRTEPPNCESVEE